MRKPLIPQSAKLTYREASRGDYPAISHPEMTGGFPGVDALKAGALQRIADALEIRNDITLASRSGFTFAEQTDGMNHFRARQTKGTRVVQIDILGTSPEKATEFITNIGEVIKLAIAVADSGQRVGLPVQYFVAAELLPAFRYYLDHYHDQDEDVQAEADKEHYQDWLETHDPGDEYGGRSEHEQPLSPDRVWVISEDEDENGNLYQLGFIGPQELFSFARYWEKSIHELVQRLEQEEGEEHD